MLFIGNSETFWNEGIDAHLLAMAASADPPIVLETAFAGVGGTALWDLFEIQEVVDQVSRGAWDVMVLQNEGCDALLEHAANLGRTLDRLMSAADLSLEFYGTSSQELLAATAELPITFYSLLQSLD